MEKGESALNNTNGGGEVCTATSKQERSHGREEKNVCGLSLRERSSGTQGRGGSCLEEEDKQLSIC